VDQRVSFFLGAAVLSLLLLPLAPPEFRIVCEVTAGVYVVLALLTALDRRSRQRELAEYEHAENQRADDQRSNHDSADDETSSAR
jgi:hypothetical protein